MEPLAFTAKSGNRKTGPIPVTISSKSTCPTSCPLRGSGCYAEQWPLVLHWERAEKANPSEALAKIRALPPGQLWRHNQAGDLPGRGDRINARSLRRLIAANRGKRGFTYTHKPPAVGQNAALIQEANDNGFTVNLSANSLAHADELAATGAGPVVALAPSITSWKRSRTPAGRPAIVCPATYRKDVTCADCGICAVPNRKAVVVFPAHGSTRIVNQLIHQLNAEKESSE